MNSHNNSESPAAAERAEESAAPVPVQASAGKQQQSPGSLGLLLRDFLLVLALVVIIFVFLYQPVRVEGTSMLPHLEDHDRLFINKFVYHFAAIQRGDVVVFHYPRDRRRAISSASSRCPATGCKSTAAR